MGVGWEGRRRVSEFQVMGKVNGRLERLWVGVFGAEVRGNRGEGSDGKI